MSLAHMTSEEVSSEAKHQQYLHSEKMPGQSSLNIKYCLSTILFFKNYFSYSRSFVFSFEFQKQFVNFYKNPH